MNNLEMVCRREESSSSILYYATIPFTLLVGWASLILTMIFIYWGPLHLVSLRLGETSVLLLNTLLSLGFFVQHSGMVRRSFRHCSRQFIKEKYQGALYTISSGVLLILIVVCWQQSCYVLASVQGGLRWLLRGAFYLSLSGILWALWSLGKFDAFGLDPLRNPARGETAAQSRLLVRGPYRWVRHPLYFFCLLMIWSFPDLTADRLLFNILWTAWIVFGSVLEERDLVNSFGEEYRQYQRQVPMLFPTRIRPAHREAPALLRRVSEKRVDADILL